MPLSGCDTVFVFFPHPVKIARKANTQTVAVALTANLRWLWQDIEFLSVFLSRHVTSKNQHKKLPQAEGLREFLNWSRASDLNRRPMLYEDTPLTYEKLKSQCEFLLLLLIFLFFYTLGNVDQLGCAMRGLRDVVHYLPDSKLDKREKYHAHPDEKRLHEKRPSFLYRNKNYERSGKHGEQAGDVADGREYRRARASTCDCFGIVAVAVFSHRVECF